MRYELIQGNAKLLTILANDGWKLVNTFPNPHPEPYFFALMSLEHSNESEYDIDVIEDLVFRTPNYIHRWKLTENNKTRKEKGEYIRL